MGLLVVIRLDKHIVSVTVRQHHLHLLHRLGLLELHGTGQLETREGVCSGGDPWETLDLAKPPSGWVCLFPPRLGCGSGLWDLQVAREAYAVRLPRPVHARYESSTQLTGICSHASVASSFSSPLECKGGCCLGCSLGGVRLPIRSPPVPHQLRSHASFYLTPRTQTPRNATSRKLSCLHEECSGRRRTDACEECLCMYELWRITTSARESSTCGAPRSLCSCS